MEKSLYVPQSAGDKLIWVNEWYKYVRHSGDNFLCYCLYHWTGSAWEHVTTHQTNTAKPEEWTFNIPNVKTHKLSDILS